MKTAISVPDETFARVEREARRLGMSRSEFFARAAERWLEELGGEEITAQINAALDHSSENEDFLREAAAQLVDPAESW